MEHSMEDYGEYDDDEYEDDDLMEDEEDEYEEVEDRKPTKEEIEYLELRQRLKEQIRKQSKKDGGSHSKFNSRKKLPYDNFGSFFGPSQPVISQRVIQESKSLLENQHLTSRVPDNVHVNKKSQGSNSAPPSKDSKPRAPPKVINEKKTKVQKLKDTRDYSFLFSEDGHVPASTIESSTSAFAPSADARSAHAPMRSNHRQNINVSHKDKKSVSMNGHLQSKNKPASSGNLNLSMMKAKQQLGNSNIGNGPSRQMGNGNNRNGAGRPMSNGNNGNGPGRPMGNSSNGNGSGRPMGNSNNGSGPGRPMGSSHNGNGSGRPMGNSNNGNSSGRPMGNSNNGNSSGRPMGNSNNGSGPGRPVAKSNDRNGPGRTMVAPKATPALMQKRPSLPVAKNSAPGLHKSLPSKKFEDKRIEVRPPAKAKAGLAPNRPVSSSRPQSRPQISKPPPQRQASSRPALNDQRSKKRPAKRYSDEEDDGEEAISLIRKMFGYNPSKFSREDDDSDMEANFDDIMAEEKRSAKIARKEDEEQLLLIQEEEERERRARIKRLKRTK